MKCIIKSYKSEESFSYLSNLNVYKHRIDESIEKHRMYSIVKVEKTSLYKLSLLNENSNSFQLFCFFICNRSFSSLIVDFYTDCGELVQSDIELIGYHRFKRYKGVK